jgi:ATP-dependent exoDNAse (exonuclease V) beta subunit
MKHNKKFIYPKCQREIINGKRHYDIKSEKLPSVTTILSATQSAEKTASLDAWRFRLKDSFIKIPDDTDPSGFTLINEAEYITKEAGDRGTAMHTILEDYMDREGQLNTPTEETRLPHNMAIQIIQNGLSNVTEYYGLEATLYYPGLYAGATDVVAIHKGQDTIIDFKQTNKPKKREWIEDYCLQLAAYTMAHNFIYRTSISKAVIMMCSKKLEYQEFIIEGKELQTYQHNFLRKVDQYYGQHKKVGVERE